MSAVAWATALIDEYEAGKRLSWERPPQDYERFRTLTTGGRPYALIRLESSEEGYPM